MAAKKPVAVPTTAMAPPAQAPARPCRSPNSTIALRSSAPTCAKLVEQAASSAGAANEELLSQRIAEQEAKLASLRKQREEIAPDE